MVFGHAVALTGGIATGKSSASAILSLLGFRVIDADTIAHEVLQEKSPQIAQLFPDSYLDENGAVDRKALGALIFSDREAREKLETLLHPAIRAEIESRSLKEERLGKPYIIDIPLFFETAHYPIERVVTVYTPADIQLQRLIKRDGLSEEEARRRIAAQMDIERKRELADWVIDNSGKLKQLQSECERVAEEIVESFSA